MPAPASRAHHSAVARPPLTPPHAGTRTRDLAAQLRRLQTDHDALQRGIRDELITLVNTHVILRSFANDALAAWACRPCRASTSPPPGYP